MDIEDTTKLDHTELRISLVLLCYPFLPILNGSLSFPPHISICAIRRYFRSHCLIIENHHEQFIGRVILDPFWDNKGSTNHVDSWKVQQVNGQRTLNACRVTYQVSISQPPDQPCISRSTCRGV